MKKYTAPPVFKASKKVSPSSILKTARPVVIPDEFLRPPSPETLRGDVRAALASGQKTTDGKRYVIASPPDPVPPPLVPGAPRPPLPPPVPPSPLFRSLVTGDRPNRNKIEPFRTDMTGRIFPPNNPNTLGGMYEAQFVPRNMEMDKDQFEQAILENPIGLPSVADGAYNVEREIKKRQDFRKAFLETKKGAFANKMAGYIQHKVEDMFVKPTSPHSIPRGFELPYDIQGAPHVANVHTNEDVTSYSNVDYAGRLAAIGNLEHPMFWAEEDLIFIPQVSAAMDSAVEDIKEKLPRFSGATTEMFYSGASMALFAELCAWKFFKHNRMDPRRTAFRDDIYDMDIKINALVIRFAQFTEDGGKIVKKT